MPRMCSLLSSLLQGGDMINEIFQNSSLRTLWQKRWDFHHSFAFSLSKHSLPLLSHTLLPQDKVHHPFIRQNRVWPKQTKKILIKHFRESSLKNSLSLSQFHPPLCILTATPWSLSPHSRHANSSQKASLPPPNPHPTAWPET